MAYNLIIRVINFSAVHFKCNDCYVGTRTQLVFQPVSDRFSDSSCLTAFLVYCQAECGGR